MHKAFWDLLRQQLAAEPPCFDHAIQLLADIKEVKLLYIKTFVLLGIQLKNYLYFSASNQYSWRTIKKP
jgi:hypothetical protein